MIVRRDRSKIVCNANSRRPIPQMCRGANRIRQPCDYSFSSLYATIERLLGIPPLGRPDAGTAQIFDMFNDVQPRARPLPRRRSRPGSLPGDRREEMEAAEEENNAHAQSTADYRTLVKSHAQPALLEPSHRWAGSRAAGPSAEGGRALGSTLREHS